MSITERDDTNSTIDLIQYARQLLNSAWAEIQARRPAPTSTYRVQVHKEFTFEQAKAIVPYLSQLGITDFYPSPYLKATPGSTHGYDVTDHSILNPEIGTEDEHDAWLQTLSEQGMGLLMDVVPNHMGILGNENLWWNDVLENGQASIHASTFDIDWSSPTRPENQGRVLLPFLGAPYGEILDQGELQVVRNEGAFHVQYFENRFPLDPKSYQAILEPAVEASLAALGEEDEDVLECQSILTSIRNLPDHTDSLPEKSAERNREKEVIKRRLASVIAKQVVIAEAIDGAIKTLNGTVGQPRTFDDLDNLLAKQPYRLAYWRVAQDEINYRRFFDINGLAAIRTDREEVFRASHVKVLNIADRHGAAGLRIDHPDGLLDPQMYLENLQTAYVLTVAHRLHQAGEERDNLPWATIEPLLRGLIDETPIDRHKPHDLYVVVEKILGYDEPYPPGWRSHGTSGYDALNRINNLFVDASNGETFLDRYEDWIDDSTPYRELVREKKLLVLSASLASELHVLAYQLERIALQDRRSRDFSQTPLRHALREVIAAFPVYRSYITSRAVSEHDRVLVDRAVGLAMRSNPMISRSLFRFLRNVLLDRINLPGDWSPEVISPAEFAGKFQQVTAPVMAKGLEDTVFYVFNRLASLNEVGGEPIRFGASADSLHRWLAERAEQFPHALTTLSTHDTKRSEDVRARINVLSEIPDDWFAAVERWAKQNHAYLSSIEDREVPDHNETYFLYQNLLGAWPHHPMDDEAYTNFRDRIREYMSKSLHEAKVHSSWMNPDPEYDGMVDRFITAILDRTQNAEFLDDFLAFQKRISHHGALNSLAQTLLKITVPGVPDTYQGTELWDFSLVDPDNRRPVDYDLRARLLAELNEKFQKPEIGPQGLAKELIADLTDSRIKLYTHWRALAARKEHPRLFSSGDYRPALPRGEYEASLFGFFRCEGPHTAIVAVPRLTTRLVKSPALPLGREVWGDTELVVHGVAPGRVFRNLFTGETVTTQVHESMTTLKAADLFKSFPIALLLA